jgi:MFS family permease
MSAAVINPAFVQLGEEFQHSPIKASYELTIYLIFAGVGPLFIAQLSNVYGRRPIYLLGNLLADVCNIVAGNCTTWTGILVTRVFLGIGASSAVAIGAATICDMYFMHQRGIYMGIYAFFSLMTYCPFDGRIYYGKSRMA